MQVTGANTTASTSDTTSAMEAAYRKSAPAAGDGSSRNEASPAPSLSKPVNVNAIDVYRGDAGQGGKLSSRADNPIARPSAFAPSVNVDTVDVAPAPGPSASAPIAPPASESDATSVSSGDAEAPAGVSGGPFANGEKPRIAILDFGFDAPDDGTFGAADPDGPAPTVGHGATVKDVIEAQQGPDGTLVDIDEFDAGASGTSESIADTAAAIVESAEKNGPYDYLSSSVGLTPETASNAATSLLVARYNEERVDNGRAPINGGTVTPRDLENGFTFTNEEKRGIVDFVIDRYSAQPSEDASAFERFAHGAAGTFDAYKSLLAQGTDIFHAGSNQQGTYDPLNLLDGFNDQGGGSFRTVQATNADVLTNEQFQPGDAEPDAPVAPPRPDAPITPLGSALDADVQAPGVVNGLDFGTASAFAVGSSFAVPEAISRDIDARRGPVDVSRGFGVADAIGPDAPGDVFFNLDRRSAQG